MNQEAEAARIERFYVEERMSLRQIADRIGRDHHYVKRRLERAGVRVVAYNKPMVMTRRDGKTVYEMACKICREKFWANNKRQKFCSRDCMGIAQSTGKTKRGVAEREVRECPFCGEEFPCRIKSTQKYCNRRCFDRHHSERMSGEGNPSYINGGSREKASYRGDDWNQIRQRIYERDNYTCQECGEKCISKDRATPSNSHLIIQCHHITPYETPNDNVDENLITLCVSCHASIHNAQGK